MDAMKPVEWICKPIVAKGTLGFIAGLPETNKTWLMMDLALECAKNDGGVGPHTCPVAETCGDCESWAPAERKWLGLFPVAHSRVLFIDQERFKGETQRRFKAAMQYKGLSAADLAGNLFLRCGTTTRLDIDTSYQAFRKELLEIKPDLVIVDSFVTFHSSDENSRMGIQVVLERIKALRTEIGCTFLFINHENKGVFSDKENNEMPSAFRMVGSVAIPAAAEFVLTVRRFDTDTVLVHHTKSTLSQAAKSFTAKVVDTDTGIRIYGEGE
jgi:hypothetical protein